MERAEVAKATSHVGEVEQELNLLRDDQEQVARVTFTQACVLPASGTRDRPLTLGFCS